MGARLVMERRVSCGYGFGNALEKERLKKKTVAGVLCCKGALSVSNACCGGVDGCK